MSKLDSAFETAQRERKDVLSGFAKASADEVRGYERGKKEGRQQMLQEFEQNLSKISSQLVAEHRKDELTRQQELAKLSGQAAVLSCAAELQRIKVAAAQNVCWRCKTSSVDPRSPYLCCSACDTKHGIHH